MKLCSENTVLEGLLEEMTKGKEVSKSRGIDGARECRSSHRQEQYMYMGRWASRRAD